jgi:hypothetical protein
VGLPDKDNAYAKVTSGSQSSIDFGLRRVVASHSVENDLARQTGFILRLASHSLVRFVLPVQPRDLYSGRTSGTRGVAFEARGSLDKG